MVLVVVMMVFFNTRPHGRYTVIGDGAGGGSGKVAEGCIGQNSDYFASLQKVLGLYVHRVDIFSIYSDWDQSRDWCRIQVNPFRTHNLRLLTVGFHWG